MPINNIQNYETEDHFDVVTGLNGKQQLKPKVPVTTQQADGGFITTNHDGSTVGPWYTDTVVIYTFPATVPESGVMSVAGSDGSTQTVTITHPDDNDIASHTITNGVVHYYDEDGVEVAGRALDLNGFISSDHPTISAIGDASATFDAAANEWVIGFTDTDTFATVSGSTVTDAAGNSVTVPAGSTYNAATNEITTSDGQVVPLMVDTDTFATQNGDGDLVLADGTVVPLVAADTNTVMIVTANLDGSTTFQNVDGNGDPVGAPVVQAADVDLTYTKHVLDSVACDTDASSSAGLTSSDQLLTTKSVDAVDGRLQIGDRSFAYANEQHNIQVANVATIGDTTAEDSVIWEIQVPITTIVPRRIYLHNFLEMHFQHVVDTPAGGDMIVKIQTQLNGGSWVDQGNGGWKMNLNDEDERQHVFSPTTRLQTCQENIIGYRLVMFKNNLVTGQQVNVNDTVVRHLVPYLREI